MFRYCFASIFSYFCGNFFNRMVQHKTHRKLPYTRENLSKRKQKYRTERKNAYKFINIGFVLVGVSLLYFILQTLFLKNPGMYVYFGSLFFGILAIAGLGLIGKGFYFFKKQEKEEEVRVATPTTDVVSLEQFEAIIQNTQDIITLLDKDAKIKYLGPSTEKVLSYKPADLLGRSFLELVHDEDRPLLLNAIRREGNFFIIFRIQHQNGKWLWFEASGSNLLKNPKIKGILLNLRDITARKNEEEQRRQKEKAALKSVIEKERVEQEKKIIEEANRKLQEAYHVIEEKNKEITDSITYAFRIQQAILPEADELTKYFNEAFIFWRPRDIVSGDFYWFHHEGRYTFVTAADCTGHGVPGAFMTMIGSTFLNRIVREEKIIMPDQILQKLDAYVRRALKQYEAKGGSQDGMDMSFITYDHEEKKLYWAGANNPLVVVNTAMIYEAQKKGETIDYDEMYKKLVKTIKPTKTGIGGYYEKEYKEFTLHTLTPDSGQMFYIYSDGFQDQFGGSKGRKFMVKKLKKLFSKIAHLPASLQEKALDKVLKEWMGKKYEQVDDILIMGVRIFSYES